MRLVMRSLDTVADDALSDPLPSSHPPALLAQVNTAPPHATDRASTPMTSPHEPSHGQTNDHFAHPEGEETSSQPRASSTAEPVAVQLVADGCDHVRTICQLPQMQNLGWSLAVAESEHTSDDGGPTSVRAASSAAEVKLLSAEGEDELPPPTVTHAGPLDDAERTAHP